MREDWWDEPSFITPLEITSEILATETLPLIYPPQSPESTNIKFINSDHYTAITLFWSSVLKYMFTDKEYANKMSCLHNLDFFLESGILKVETKERIQDGEEYVLVDAWYWCFTEGRYSYIEEMEVMDIEWLARVVEYYGGVN